MRLGLFTILAMMTIVGSASAGTHEPIKSKTESQLSVEIKASRAAIAGFPELFLWESGKTLRSIYLTPKCLDMNDTTICKVLAASSEGKYVVSIRVEKQSDGKFLAVSAQTEDDLL